MATSKGSDFERLICKKLSLWWTNGERDDVFWRSSGSGARAKTRSKKGMSTFGQYGDIQATDPIGQPLIDLVTIELKRGYNKTTIVDMLDKPGKAAVQQWELFFRQVDEDCRNAKSKGWLLIHRRDRREAMVTMPKRVLSLLGFLMPLSDVPHLRGVIRTKDNWSIRVVTMTLDTFLDRCRRD